MRRFGRFIILAVLGFALGAGLAYVQAMQEAKKQVAAPQQAESAMQSTPAETEVSAVADAGTAAADVNNATETPAVEPAVQPAETAISNSALDTPETTPAAEAQEETTSESTSALPTNEAATGSAPAAESNVVAQVPGSSVGGAFALTDHNGLKVTEKSWPGKYKLVFFGFTRCPDICPTTLDKLTDVLNAMGTETAKVQTLFITTDAKRDTPDVMKTYLGGYHSSIVGLTGTKEELKATQDTYKVYAAEVPAAAPTEADNYMMDHSSYVFLMTPDDQMIEIFKKDDTAADMAGKIQGHLANAPAP